MNVSRRFSSGVFVLALLASGCQSQAPSEPAAATAESAAPHLAKGRINFVDGYQAGYEQGVRENRPMLVFFTAGWCGFCHQMANDAFTDDQVVNLSERFLCILVDADAEPQVCQQFHVRGYPTIQFLSPRGVPLNRVVGKQAGHHLVMEMQAALQAVARRAESPADALQR
jgi:thioredoxin-like negative regulator of GroEL